jgi:multicomponent Na+:H+ antiporter subunit C
MRLDIILSFVILLIGLYGMATGKTVIKSIICMSIVQTAVVFIFLGFVYSSGSRVPILSEGVEAMVDPLPQALMITTIVIGAAITALALSFSIKLFHNYGTLNWKELMKREG